jgi:hypothetical protein
MLICEHPVAESDEESINSAYISDLCSKDWGLWRTVTGNLHKLESFLPRLVEDASDRERVLKRIENLIQVIESKEKTFAWRMRAKIGEKKKWYREVEEVERE